MISHRGKLAPGLAASLRLDAGSFSPTPAKTNYRFGSSTLTWQERGLDPWLDEVDLLPGQIWKEEIPKAIRKAKIFLACLSTRSVKKVGYIQNEFRLALSAFGERPPGSIFLIPARLDDCEVPDLQIPDRGLTLRDIHSGRPLAGGRL